MKNSFIYKKRTVNKAPDWFLLSIGNQVRVSEFGRHNALSVNGVILENGDIITLNDDNTLTMIRGFDAVWL